MNYFIEIEKNEGLKQSTGSALPLNIPASMPQDQIPKKPITIYSGNIKKLVFALIGTYTAIDSEKEITLKGGYILFRWESKYPFTSAKG